MLYFAYGSNLWREQMHRRCPEHQLIGPATLPGYRWIITSRGYASIVSSEADQVCGVVYALSAADEASLDRYEGVEQELYYKQQVQVALNGSFVRCMTYIDPTTTEGTPLREYRERLGRGIADAGLPTDYQIRYLKKYLP